MSISIDEVLREVVRQEHTWGKRDQSKWKWLPILIEEVGEVSEAMLEYSDDTHVREELIQCAAVILSWLENIDRREGHE